MKRSSGVLMHISSLHGNYSCGGLGKEAREFVDFLAECGFSWWQVLPLCMGDEFNSPYKSCSAFGGNPFFIDLEAMLRKGYLTKGEFSSATQKMEGKCEFERLRSERIKLLEKCAKRAFSADEARKTEDFVSKHPHIENFCRFMALKKKNNNKCWIEWTHALPDGDDLFAWKFIQHEFFSQWAELKTYANSKGVKILGDIPFYVSYDSSDVWANKEQFLLNDEGSMKKLAGVPPDAFSPMGQLWGNPIYNWEEMKRDSFRWWRDRLAFAAEMFDGVRIDHFRAIESYWSIDANAQTACDGTWQKGPGMDFVDAIKNAAKDVFVVAEDLGNITPEVKDLVEKSGFSCMRVFQFGFDGDSDSPHLPHNYSKNTVAYTGTHDNDTLAGFTDALDETRRRFMLDYCSCRDYEKKHCHDSIIRTLFSSGAGLCILPVQDILMQGSGARLNTPGTTNGNWQYRITKRELDRVDRSKYRNLNFLYKRE